MESELFQKLKEEIAEGYLGLSLQEKVNEIAKVFGGQSGTIITSPCTGNWRGTSDVSIRMDNGKQFFLGNTLTPTAKTKAAQTKFVDIVIQDYNQKIVRLTKKGSAKEPSRSRDGG